LIAGRCHWTGDWWKDYGFHIINWHPLLSIGCCDPMNPYGNVERFAVLMVMSSLTLLPYVYLEQTLGHETLDFFWFSVDGPTASLIARSILVTIPAMLLQYTIEYLIYFDVTFQMFGSVRYVGCFFRCTAFCMRCSKRCFFCFALGLSLICTAYAYIQLRSDEVKFLNTLRPFLISRASSWLLWFLTDMFVPCISFRRHWRVEKRSQERRAAREEERKEIKLRNLRTRARRAGVQDEEIESAASEDDLNRLIIRRAHEDAAARRCPCVMRSCWERAKRKLKPLSRCEDGSLRPLQEVEYEYMEQEEIDIISQSFVVP
jgi:hypothetical protein